MMSRLICLARGHQWHNGWDDVEHATVWTCRRCGKIREEPVEGDPRWGPSAWTGGSGGGG